MAETVAVIDYGAGNLRSVANALAAAGARVEVTGDTARVAAADRIVLPGVGAFGQCIGALRGVDGMEDALTEAVRMRGVPFLGICVGMQLLADEGHEHGVHRGLGWIAGTVDRLAPGDPALKVPHSGWSRVEPLRPGIAGGEAYFVHSYKFAAADPGDVLATVDHGGAFPAVIGRGNIRGVQFHPEKSQAYGLAFLRAWLAG